MKQALLYVLFIITYSSCQNSKELKDFDYPILPINSDENSVKKHTKHNKRIDTIDFPSLQLMNGQTLTIQYSSNGCFHHQNEIVKIKRLGMSYLLSCSTMQGENETKILSDGLVDSSLILTLIDFSNYWRGNLAKNIKDSILLNKGGGTSSTSLTISDGFHYFDIPVADNFVNYSLINAFAKNIFKVKTNGS